MAKDLLLEIGAEELPASVIVPALEDMKNIFATKAKEARLGFGEMRVYGTPRRLALLVDGVADAQEDLNSEVLGPPSKVAFDAEGKPTPIAEKWAAGQGVALDQIKRKETPKGEYIYIDRFEKGQKADRVLPELLLAVVKGARFPKKMRWGWEEESFSRPVQWIAALHGTKVVKFSFADVKSSNVSLGHRFLSKKPIKLTDAAGYLAALEGAHVIADPEKRKALVKAEVEKAALATGGGKVLDDPALLETVTYLVEHPTGVLGTFEKEYLDLPPEVLVSEAKGHQKYFSVTDSAGRIMPNFVAVSNMPVKDTDVSRAGYERVLRARLSDARFFFNEDRKAPLHTRVDQLKRVTFQQKLGTSYEKMERFRALAIWLAHQVGLGVPALDVTSISDHLATVTDPAAGDKGRMTNTIARAAYLSKADLVTGMVGEFPELQGIMGREYAKTDETWDVALAIFEHYLPRNASDTLPTQDAGAIIGIADRLDLITGIGGIGKWPTGATDQFALRRACLAVIRIVLDRGYRFSLSATVDRSLELLGPKIANREKTRGETMAFFRDRLVSSWKEKGHRPDVVEAVLSAGFDDLVAAHRRLEAMSAIVGRPDFDPLAVAFKRVVNIVQKQAKGQGGKGVEKALLTEPAELALFEAFEAARGKIESAVKSQDFAGALKEITALKPAVDLFFDKVLVMAEDPKVKENRVALLVGIGALFGGIADFSKIQAGEQGQQAKA